MIIIIAPRDDFHAILARHVIRDRFGEDCEILDLAAFPQSTQLSLEIVGDRHQMQYRGDVGDVDWRDVSTVWWRRPQLHSASDGRASGDAETAFVDRECSSLVMSLFNESRPRVINRPKEQLLAACKGTQLLGATRLSIPVPDTLITNSRDDAEAFRSRHKSCVFKALTWMDGQRLIPTRTLTDAELEDPDALQAAPLIVQEQLPAGSDIRVNIFGTDVYAAAKPVTTVDGRLEGQPWHEHSLPDPLSHKLVDLLGALGLDYGCVDLRLLPDGRYFFLEVNPSGQFLMVERDTKQPLIRSLCRLLTA
jgi:glutathione synthase/RimK-type ligase-like ATP-grasp enzyme